VRRGERILITGDPSVTLGLFKAVAGLWPWGSGEIVLPEGQDLVFMPQHPYLPKGSLRAVLSYPQPEDHYGSASIYRAMECAGIVWLTPRLDEVDDWNRALPLRAQQRLAMARLFLQQPAWVFIEGATDTFDPKAEACLLEMLHHELPNSTLLTISQHGDVDHFYDRKLELWRVGDRRIRPAAP
jgi:putative ATP-binding cassette transporter